MTPICQKSTSNTLVTKVDLYPEISTKRVDPTNVHVYVCTVSGIYRNKNLTHTHSTVRTVKSEQKSSKTYKLELFGLFMLQFLLHILDFNWLEMSF